MEKYPGEELVKSNTVTGSTRADERAEVPLRGYWSYLEAVETTLEEQILSMIENNIAPVII